MIGLRLTLVIDYHRTYDNYGVKRIICVVKELIVEHKIRDAVLAYCNKTVIENFFT